MKNLLIILNIIFIPALWANDLNSHFSEAGNLTDQQVQQSREFVHEGIKDKIVTEGCQSLDNCQVEDDSQLERVIGQVYTTALPAILKEFKSDSTKSSKDTPTQDVKDNKEVKNNKEVVDNKEAPKENQAPQGEEAKDQTDWCMIAAMGYEMYAMIFQEKMQKEKSKSAEEIPDSQLRTLVNLRETHKARKKSANYQATAYGVVTGCYALMLMGGGLTWGWDTGIKMGGAALLTTLYMKKADKHDRLADKVQTVINSLPKSGECNPWTQSSCFCEEPTSRDRYPAEFQEVCVLNGGDFNTPKMAMGCAATDANGKVTYDEQCHCKQTNTCVSAKISAFTPTLSGVTNLMNQMKSGVELLDSGFYDEAKLKAYSTQTAAMGSKLARQIENPNPQPVKLTEDQKKVAKELAGLVTPELAAQIASAEPHYPENSIANPGDGKASLSLAEKKEEGLKAKGVKGKYKTGVAANTSPKKEKGFTMPNLLNQKKAPASSSVEIMNFAERAVSNADVSNTPDTPIFDIISNRYRHTWKRLDEKAQALE